MVGDGTFRIGHTGIAILHKVFNRNSVKVSYSCMPNAINQCDLSINAKINIYLREKSILRVSSKFYTENKCDWYSVVPRYFVVRIPVIYLCSQPYFKRFHLEGSLLGRNPFKIGYFGIWQKFWKEIDLGRKFGLRKGKKANFHFFLVIIMAFLS